jgi:type VI secretion system protein VasD
MKRLFPLILLSLCLACLTGCASSELGLNFYTDKTLNPDEDFDSLPVEVKVFQLTTDAAFNRASFDDLWRHPKSSLGNTLLRSSSYTLLPADTKNIAVKVDDNATVVGFMAVFLHPESTQWKVTVPISSWYLFEPEFEIDLEGRHIMAKQVLF